MKQVAYSLQRGIDSQMHFLLGFSGVVVAAAVDRVLDGVDAMKKLVQMQENFAVIEHQVDVIDEAMRTVINAEAMLIGESKKKAIEEGEKRRRAAIDAVVGHVDELVQLIATIRNESTRMFLDEAARSLDMTIRFLFRLVIYLEEMRVKTDMPLDMWEILKKQGNVSYRLSMTEEEQIGVMNCIEAGVRFVVDEMDMIIRHSVVKKAITGKRIPIKAALSKMQTACEEIEKKLSNAPTAVVAAELFDQWYAMVGLQNKLAEQVLKVIRVLDEAADKENNLEQASAMLNSHTNILGYGLAGISMLFSTMNQES